MDKYPRHYQRGSSDSEGLLVLVGIVVFLWWLFSDNGERDGHVRYDDCREVVTLSPDSYQHFLKPFTCVTVKTGKGKVMGGSCVHIDYDGSFFSGSHGCKVAYIYEKKQDDLCRDPKYPHLGYDDMCHE